MGYMDGGLCGKMWVWVKERWEDLSAPLSYLYLSECQPARLGEISDLVPLLISDHVIDRIDKAVFLFNGSRYDSPHLH
jgi:hypothetical protein